MHAALLILPDFAIILLGVILLRRLGFPENFWKKAELLIYYVLFPPLLFTSVATAKLSIMTAGSFLAVGVTMMLSAVLLSGAVKYLVKSDDITHASAFQCAFRFNSYIGFALCLRLYGDEGFALLALLIAVWVPISSAIAVAKLAKAVTANHETPNAPRQSTFFTIMTNPLIIATVSGLIVNVTAIPMPTPFIQMLKELGNASIAMGLLAIGAGLRTENIRSTFALITTATALRLIAVPVIGLILCWFFPLENLSCGVLLLFAALPTASSCYVLAASMGGNGAIVANITTAQTLASMVTLPFWIAIIQSIFPVS